jgi:Acetyltransferase (GNAT) domain
MGNLGNLIWEIVSISRRELALERWRDLSERFSCSPLISADAVAIALTHFGRGDERFAFGTRDGVDCIAIIFCRPRLGVLELFLPSQLPLAPILCVTEKTLNPTDLRNLISTASPTGILLRISALDAICGSDFSEVPGVHKSVLLETPTVELPEKLSAYIAQRAKKFRSDLRRRRKKAENEVGPIRFDALLDPSNVAAGVIQFGALEERGWKGAAGTAVNTEGSQFSFYHEWLSVLAQKGHARIFVLNIGGSIAAMRLAIQQGDCLYMLKVSYDENMRAYSPGALMLESVIEWCYGCSTQIRRIEFYGKTSESHMPWLTSTRPIYSATIYRFKWLSLLNSARK